MRASILTCLKTVEEQAPQLAETFDHFVAEGFLEEDIEMPADPFLSRALASVAASAISRWLLTSKKKVQPPGSAEQKSGSTCCSDKEESNGEGQQLSDPMESNLVSECCVNEAASNCKKGQRFSDPIAGSCQ